MPAIDGGPFQKITHGDDHSYKATVAIVIANATK